MSSAPATDQNYRVDLRAPQGTLMPLTPSPWALSSTFVPMLKWIALIMSFTVFASITERFLPPNAKIVFPALFMVAAALYVVSIYRKKPQPSLLLIEHTLHRLAPDGTIIETIADLRGELTLGAWSYSARGTKYFGRALLLRFPSGVFAVSLYPSATPVAATACDSPAWIIEPAHFQQLVSTCQFTA